MRDVRRHEDDRASGDVAHLVTDADSRSPREHVIDLVLRMRRLALLASNRQHVQPDAQIGNAQELQVGAAICLQPGNLAHVEDLHAYLRSPMNSGHGSIQAQ